MNILATQYTLENRAFEIYVSGCSGNPHCKGCHNPETWDFNKGVKFDKEYLGKIISKIKGFDGMIDRIFIMGGEPLDQDILELMNEMVHHLFVETGKELWLFTRYNYEECIEKLSIFTEYFDYIKCGRYDDELITDDNIQFGIKLASSNQKIYKIKRN